MRGAGEEAGGGVAGVGGAPGTGPGGEAGYPGGGGAAIQGGDPAVAGAGRAGRGDPDLSKWIGREERVEGSLDLSHARAVAAMFDDPPEGIASGDPLPPLWHWFYFPPVVRASEVGPDGHPRRGGFLPPVPLPRRMWAGGRVQVHAPLPVGAPAARHSRILAVEEKHGRSGALVLVTVEHRIVHDGVAAVVEEQDLIYREAPGEDGAEGGRPAPARDASPPAAATPGFPPPATAGMASPPRPSPGAGGGADPATVPSGWDWMETATTDPVLLFRFSALTFNGHRIHYDHPYTTQVEGYPGLVVHGPLGALLLMRAGCTHGGGAPASFSYRGKAPLFCGDPITLLGRRAPADGPGEGSRMLLESRRPDGSTAMEARITWPSPRPAP